MPFVLTPLPGIPSIRAGDDLAGLALAGTARSGLRLEDGDILVIAQKVVSKVEGRIVDLASVHPSPEAKRLAVESLKDPRLVELILRESRVVLRVRPGVIVVEHRLGFVCANAGIDRSNIETPGGSESVLLLPEDPDASAEKIRQALQSATGANLGVLIIDSHGRAWRLGTVGAAIGLAGIPALVDLRGEMDLYGYRLESTVVAAADELASAASLVMGQAAEGLPFIHVRGFPYPLRDSKLQELIRPRELDLFR
jgi:coenzyme F420-0:L-glutamate ligase/coenzyme F420-1:gamma-L-glutamate ligase